MGAQKNPGIKQQWQRRAQSSPHLHIFRALSRNLHRHPSATQGHLHTIYSILNLGQPRTLPALTSIINCTLLTVRYTPILSKCPNHLKILRSSLLDTLSTAALLHTYTSSFKTLSIRVTATKLLAAHLSQLPLAQCTIIISTIIDFSINCLLTNSNCALQLSHPNNVNSFD